MKLEKNIRNNGNIHKALKLPSTYAVRVSLEGPVMTNHWSLRIMGSPTGGHTTVYALSVNWVGWRETNKESWMRVAKRILESE